MNNILLTIQTRLTDTHCDTEIKTFVTDQDLLTFVSGHTDQTVEELTERLRTKRWFGGEWLREGDDIVWTDLETTYRYRQIS